MDGENGVVGGRVQRKKHLLEGIFFTYGGIVRATVKFSSCIGLDGKMIINIYSVVFQLGSQTLVKKFVVDALGDRNFIVVIKDGDGYLVEKFTLAEILLPDIVLHVLGNGGVRSGYSFAQDKSFR